MILLSLEIPMVDLVVITVPHLVVMIVTLNAGNMVLWEVGVVAGPAMGLENMVSMTAQTA